MTLVVFSLAFNSQGQIVNYISNGGFESLSSTTVVSYFNSSNYWQALDTGKYAYFLYSTNPTIASAPNCAQGFQKPRSGNSFIAPTAYCTTCPINNSRGYPRNRLKNTLTAGKTYCAKFYYVNTNNSPLAIDSYGAYLGDSSLDTITKCTIPLTYLNPQIENQSGIITDTMNWVPISGTFTANGTEKYLVIGNFKSDIATNTVLINPANLPMLVCDVYIDDVSLIEMDLPAFAGRDTFFIPGTPVFIGREPDVGLDEHCMWYKWPNMTTAIDTVAGLWVTPVGTTTYLVRQQLWCSGVKWDTVVVHESAVGIRNSFFDSAQDDLKLYPVPAKDYVEVLVSDKFTQGICRAFIYNALGQLIREEELLFKERRAVFQTGDLPNGAYLITISNSSYESSTKKLLIAK